MPTPTPSTICVDLDGHGHWDVAMSDPDTHLTCGTFDDARRVAHQRATRRRPCELVVRDAYHRVVSRELMADSDEKPSA
jgi:hypothetical protein